MISLTIITINFNNAAGLEKTIDSVVNQTSSDFEYIIIDGGSTDGSLDVIKANAHKINYWVSEPDNGIYHAMNKGITQAKGDYCQFLNSGDTLCAPHVTETVLGRIRQTSIHVGNMIKIWPDGKIYKDKGNASRPVTFFTFYRSTINHSPAYIPRRLFEKYGLYDENLRIVSDWKWYLQVVGLNNEEVIYQNIDVTYFDMEGISNTNKELERHERRTVLESLVPGQILTDYDQNWLLIDRARRIDSYKISHWIFWLIDRLLFRIEKLTGHL